MEEVTVNREALRKLIQNAFSDDDLYVFCFDHFPEVYEYIHYAMPKPIKAVILADYCIRHGQVERLLQLLEQANPYQYNQLKHTLTEAYPHPFNTNLMISRDDLKQVIKIKIDGVPLEELSEIQKKALLKGVKATLVDVLGIEDDEIGFSNMESGSILLEIELPFGAAQMLLLQDQTVLAEELGFSVVSVNNDEKTLIILENQISNLQQYNAIEEIQLLIRFVAEAQAREQLSVDETETENVHAVTQKAEARLLSQLPRLEKEIAELGEDFKAVSGVLINEIPKEETEHIEDRLGFIEYVLPRMKEMFELHNWWRAAEYAEMIDGARSEVEQVVSGLNNIANRKTELEKAQNRLQEEEKAFSDAAFSNIFVAWEQALELSIELNKPFSQEKFIEKIVEDYQRLANQLVRYAWEVFDQHIQYLISERIHEEISPLLYLRKVWRIVYEAWLLGIDPTIMSRKYSELAFAAARLMRALSDDSDNSRNEAENLIQSLLRIQDDSTRMLDLISEHGPYEKTSLFFITGKRDLNLDSLDEKEFFQRVRALSSEAARLSQLWQFWLDQQT